MIRRNPTDLPDDHPLADYNGTLDDHESHLDAISQYIGNNTGEIDSVFFVVNTSELSDTIPSMREGIDFEQHMWFQLSAHISHVASALGVAPEQVASHACHVLRDQTPDPDVHRRDDGGEDA